MPVLIPGPTTSISWLRYRPAIVAHSGPSWGTVDDTIDAVRSSRVTPRSSSRLRSAAPSSSAVDSRTVANRQCSTSSSPRHVPKCVWVLPTSTTRSMGGQSMFGPVAIDLYVVHGSHPCAAVERALELKGLDYRVVELPPPLHAPLQRVRFGARTVPAIELEGGEKISGSRAILRRLDELAPEPALWPAGEKARALVERAEEWGDEVYQPIARRLLWGAIRRRPAALVSYSEGLRIPLPKPAIRAAAPAIARAEIALNRASEGALRADLRNLPRHLDRIDGWIVDGVIGGPAPNAADLQIATTSRLLLTIGDVALFFAGRPAESHARDLFGPQPGSVPPGAFPADWLAGSPPQR